MILVVSLCCHTVDVHFAVTLLAVVIYRRLIITNPLSVLLLLPPLLNPPSAEPKLPPEIKQKDGTIVEYHHYYVLQFQHSLLHTLHNYKL